MFDTETFLKDQFGGPDAILGLANVNNVPIPARDTIRKWFQRGSVSSEWWPTLFFLAECDKGHPVSLIGYFGSEGNTNDIFG